MNPIEKKAEQVFDIYANEYNEWIFSIKTYNDSLLFLADSIKNKSATILDLACGPGNITKFLLNKNPNYKILGVDLAPNMIKVAKLNNPNANFLIQDCRNLTGFNQKFDTIVCGFGLPYLNKDESIQLIKDCSQLLKPNGLLYISTIANDIYNSKLETSSSGEYKTQMYYHPENSLIQTLLDSSLKIIYNKTYETKNRKNEMVEDIVLIGQLQ